MRQISALEIGYQHAQINARIHDMPIGDAFKGPAYGEYEKSKALGMVLGVVSSVFTMGAALPMLASTALATQIAGGVMLAGGVLTGVGAVTGNTKLMKTGGVLSLAGGIGNWALNATGTAGSLGTGSEALSKFANNVGETFGMDFAAAGAGEAASGAAVEAGAATAPEAGTIQLADGVMESAGLPPVQEGGFLNSAMNAPAASGTGAAVDAAGAGAATTAFGKPIAQINLANSGGTAAAAGAPAAEQGFFNKSLSFIRENSELAKIGADAVKTFATTGFSPDQQGLLDAQTKQYGAQAELIENQNILLAWQNENRTKQVALISANDPAKDAKVAAATKAGHAVSIIPVVGRPQPVPGTTPTTNAQTITANNPAPVFNATVPVAK